MTDYTAASVEELKDSLAAIEAESRNIQAELGRREGVLRAFRLLNGLSVTTEQTDAIAVVQAEFDKVDVARAEASQAAVEEKA